MGRQTGDGPIAPAIASASRPGAPGVPGWVDRQVKIRGFRIELAEIELALTSLPEVAEAAVVLREDLPGGRGLAAWVAPRSGGSPADLTPSALLAALQQKLPAYMVPAHFVTVGALPLTPNGKVDRRGLEQSPLPGAAGLAENGTAPRTPVEQLLCDLFAAVLERAPAGIETDFFELGGHSLLATQLMSRVRAAFGVDLPVRTVFEKPTIAGLAREIEKARQQSRGFEICASSRWTGAAICRCRSPSSGSGSSIGWSRGRRCTTCRSRCARWASWRRRFWSGRWARWCGGTRCCARSSRTTAAGRGR